MLYGTVAIRGRQDALAETSQFGDLFRLLRWYHFPGNEDPQLDETVPRRRRFIDAKLSSGIHRVSDCREQIEAAVQKAVRSLQFEDIATQALGSVGDHLDRLEHISREALVLTGLLPTSAANTSDERVRELKQFNQRIQPAREQWKQTPHHPVTQESLDEGSIELF